MLSPTERALRLIAAAFFALAVYLLAQTAVVLLAHARPAPSPLGIVWLAIVAAAMFLPAWGKRRTGRQLGNPANSVPALDLAARRFRLRR